jgi:hypothetical protein
VGVNKVNISESLFFWNVVFFFPLISKNILHAWSVDYLL